MSVTKQQWIDALLSGKYAQDNGSLRTINGFCCLGVLCDLEDPTQWAPPIPGKYAIAYTRWDLKFHHYPPDELMKDWGGNDGRIDELFTRDGVSLSLALANDTGCTFPQIADLIRHFF